MRLPHVLIPAAGPAAVDATTSASVSCPAMIPVAGRPVISWTLRYLESLGLDTFTIGVARRGLFVEDFVGSVLHEGHSVDYVVPEDDRGLAVTIRDLAESVPSGPVLVVLGDTHFTFEDAGVVQADQPFVLVDEVEESFRWCIAEVDDDQVITALHDKVADRPGPQLALIGVYFFPDVVKLRDAARLTVDEDATPEFVGILRRIGTETPIRAIRSGSWLDCGNPDQQARSQRRLLQQRAFNQLEVDATFGTITKRSTHVEKFLDEINYLRLLPAKLAVLFPRPFEYSTDYAEPWITLEFYGYPTLSELFVFEDVDPALWHRVFEHLHGIMTAGFMTVERPVDAQAIRAMYLDKTRRRLAEVDAPAELVELVSRDEVVVNGRPLRGLPSLWEHLEVEVDKLAVTAVGAAIHGDLCFSNVLYDLRSGICKLIDPRGSFGGAGIHGDPRYDVAKLHHSVHGLYDFIVSDLFRVRIDGREASLDIRHRPRHEAIAERFDDVFYSTFDRRQIELISGLILVSLPPLHFDDERRQAALYLRGLQLLDGALS